MGISEANTAIDSQKLEILLDITNAINFNQKTPQLLNRFESFLKENLHIQKLALFSNDSSQWNCILQYGSEQYIPIIDPEKDLLPIKETEIVSESANSHLKAFEAVIPVYHKSLPLAYLLIGDLHKTPGNKGPAIKHLPFIQTLTNIIIVAIENKRMAKEKIKQEGIRKELELASQMQSMLFPEQLPDDKNLEAAAFYKPHQEIGGDYYDFIYLNENEVMICMADVSGKGISAAFLMSNFQASIRALVKNKGSLVELIRELNANVMSSAKNEKFITLFIAKYNIVTRVMSFINAGHNPPVFLTGGTLLTLTTGCAGLGMFDELTKIKEGIITVAPGSVMVCYTDGVVELEDADGEDFGVEKLKKIVKENNSMTMQELNLKISNDLENFKGPKGYFDDIALLSCRFR
jgi:phosphoserine phosphatase RsbU/P